MSVARLALFTTIFCLTRGSSNHNYNDIRNYSHSIRQNALTENNHYSNNIKYYSREPSVSEKHFDDNNLSDSFLKYGSDEKQLNWEKKNINKNRHNEKDSSNSRSRELDDSADSADLSSRETSDSSSSERFNDLDNNSVLTTSEINKSGKSSIIKENLRIKTLLNKLNRMLYIKNNSKLRNMHDLDIQRILKESILQKWKEMEIAVKLILIDNHRYIRKTLLVEMMNNKSANRQEILRLERKLLQLYYTFKKDVLQTVRLTKIQYRIEVSKQNLNRQKALEVEQLYISKLKEQINNKIIALRRNVTFALEDFHLALKPVIEFTTQHIVTDKTSTEVPFDPVYESTTDTVYIMTTYSTNNPTAPGHVSIENLPTSTLNEIDDTQFTENSSTSTGQGSHRFSTRDVDYTLEHNTPTRNKNYGIMSTIVTYDKPTKKCNVDHITHNAHHHISTSPTIDITTGRRSRTTRDTQNHHTHGTAHSGNRSHTYSTQQSQEITHRPSKTTYHIPTTESSTKLTSKLTSTTSSHGHHTTKKSDDHHSTHNGHYHLSTSPTAAITTGHSSRTTRDTQSHHTHGTTHSGDHGHTYSTQQSQETTHGPLKTTYHFPYTESNTKQTSKVTATTSPHGLTTKKSNDHYSTHNGHYHVSTSPTTNITTGRKSTTTRDIQHYHTHGTNDSSDHGNTRSTQHSQKTTYRPSETTYHIHNSETSEPHRLVSESSLEDKYTKAYNGHKSIKVYHNFSHLTDVHQQNEFYQKNITTNNKELTNTKSKNDLAVLDHQTNNLNIQDSLESTNEDISHST